MASLKELREERGQLEHKMREIVDRAEGENRDLNDEENQSFEQLHERDMELQRRIERQEQLETIGETRAGDLRRGEVPGGGSTISGNGLDAQTTEEQRELALQAWFLTQIDEEIRDEHRAACQALNFNPDKKKLILPLYNTRELRSIQDHWRTSAPGVAQQRALGTVDAAKGGSLVGSRLMGALEVALLSHAGIRQTSDIIRTQSGELIPWPTFNDTGNKGRRLGEGQAAATDVDPATGAVNFSAYDYTSDAAVVSQNLIDDSMFDISTTIGSALGERLGRITNEENTVGTGNGQPRGIATAAQEGKVAAKATQIHPDEIFDLYHSVDPAYREAPTAGFMGHDAVYAHLRKLKDGEGRYIWQSGLEAGVPNRLLGRPANINQSMANSVASGNRVLLFGDLFKFKIREVGQIAIYRLTERFRLENQEGFVAFLRQDANLVDAGTGPIRYLRMA